MRGIERHERERYRILCALRAMHDRLSSRRVPEPDVLGAFVEVLRGCVLEAFFPCEEALVDRWERLVAIPPAESALAPLLHTHRITRDQVEELVLRMQERREDPQTLRVRVDRVVLLVTASLVRGQDAVDGVERSVEASDDPGLERQLEGIMPPAREREIIEKRLADLIERIQAGALPRMPAARPAPGSPAQRKPSSSRRR